MIGPYLLCLTGGIGMGKSTTAAMFAENGVPVWDADAAVHRLYAPGGQASGPLAALVPEAVSEKGVDRAILRQCIARDPALLPRIEKAVHPLVAQDRMNFIARHQGDAIILLDIPLLYETGGEGSCHGVVVVSVAADTQRARVLARGSMSADDLDRILARQMPDREKRARARWVIDTTTFETARTGVQAVLRDIRKDLTDA